MSDSHTVIIRETQAAVRWWESAGLCYQFSDDVTAWLASTPSDTNTHELQTGLSKRPKAAEIVHSSQVKVQKNAPVSGSDRIISWDGEAPRSLEDFRQFWLEAPSLDPIGTRGRVPPRGLAQADLMVLVADPEQHDTERLLSGPQGQLLSGILAAIGIREDQVYIASVLPRHTPMADFPALAKAGLAEILSHHIKLSAPRRVIAFGFNILPLLGLDPPDGPQSLREINLGTASVPARVHEGLDSLLTMPKLKSRFWRRWIEWSATHQ
ncbi:MAG: uracil-DNA glycosylase family protein [Pseudomonadota bacterium]